MIDYCKANSPLPEALTAREVGDTAAFLLSPLGVGHHRHHGLRRQGLPRDGHGGRPLKFEVAPGEKRRGQQDQHDQRRRDDARVRAARPRRRRERASSGICAVPRGSVELAPTRRRARRRRRAAADTASRAARRRRWGSTPTRSPSRARCRSTAAAAGSARAGSISVSSKRFWLPVAGRTTIDRDVTSSIGETGRAPASALRASAAPPKSASWSSSKKATASRGRSSRSFSSTRRRKRLTSSSRDISDGCSCRIGGGSVFSTAVMTSPRIAPVPRTTTGEHLVGDDAEREQIGAAVDGPTADLLGRQVLRRAEAEADARDRAAARACARARPAWRSRSRAPWRRTSP